MSKFKKLTDEEIDKLPREDVKEAAKYYQGVGSIMQRKANGAPPGSIDQVFFKDEADEYQRKLDIVNFGLVAVNAADEIKPPQPPKPADKKKK